MRQEVYRVAYDEASAELSEILGRFEQLRLRKERVEKVVDALKPLVIAAEAERAAMPERQSRPIESPLQSSSPAPAEQVQTNAPSPIPYPVQQSSNDPFGRRSEVAVGQSGSARDVSEYSRLFNTGVSRGN